MVEELYVYDKNGVRLSVDLTTPSGITLKWVSNLFNSLDKVSCSYSYTFKIPMTRHNREVFDFAEDVRHNSEMLGKKVKAEYVQNGIPLFKNGNLYLKQMANDSYSCVFTFDVLDGLQRLKDDSCSLNELRKELINVGYEDDELSSDGVVEWCLDFLTGGSEVFQFDNGKKILRPYYGVLPSDPNYKDYPFKNGYTTAFSQGVPKPVMPLRYIIEKINEIYQTNFELGSSASGIEKLQTRPISEWLMKEENIITYGVLPLTGIDLTDKQINNMSLNLVFNGIHITKKGFNDYKGILGTPNILLFEKPILVSPSTFEYIDLKDDIEYISYAYRDDEGNKIFWDIPTSKDELVKYSASTASEWTKPKYTCVGIRARIGCPIKFEGKFYIDMKSSTKLTQDLYDNLKLHVYSWKSVNIGWSDEHIERFEVSSFTATSIEKRLDENLNTCYRLNFNFMEAEGYETGSFKSDYDSSGGFSEYWFSIGDNYTEIKNIVFEEPLVMTPKVNETDDGTYPHRIDTYTNLPDIDCLELMKSIFYILGSFPYIDNKGAIRAKKYVEIKNNLSAGNVYDWSNKILTTDNTNTEITSHLDSFKQKNYYMSKWDDLDRTEADLKEEDDVYEDGVGSIKCQDTTMDKEQTVHQAPFYPPYILNRKYPLATDCTIKAKSYDLSNANYSVNDRGEIVNSNKEKYVESKPALGYIHRIPFFDTMREYRIKPWEENYGVEKYTRMSVLNPFKDILMNPSYRYLQEIVEHPFVITENLVLNEFDIMDIDYAKPVYLEKYNSYFAIISIQRNSKGLCKCELVKLPTYKPPVKITLSFDSQFAKSLHYNITTTSKEDRTITIGFIISNDTEGEYVQHSKVNLNGGAFQAPNPTSNTNWKIKEVWLDHYEEGDYNDYEFEIQ